MAAQVQQDTAWSQNNLFNKIQEELNTRSKAVKKNGKAIMDQISNKTNDCYTTIVDYTDKTKHYVAEKSEKSPFFKHFLLILSAISLVPLLCLSVFVAAGVLVTFGVCSFIFLTFGSVFVTIGLGSLAVVFFVMAWVAAFATLFLEGAIFLKRFINEYKGRISSSNISKGKKGSQKVSIQ